MRQWKQTYLILLIVISLFSLALYSTYAMFTMEINTNDIVSIDTTVSLDTNIDEYKYITIDSNSYKKINLDVYNTQNRSSYYGIWYELLNKDIENFNAYKIDSSSATTMDIIGIQEKKNISLVFINNSQKKITIKLGIEISETTSLNLDENQTLILDEIKEENIKNQTAAEYLKSLSLTKKNEMYYKEEDLIYYSENPNNYIIFNNELWRIIGIYHNEIKIIKEDNIGTYLYSNESNDFESSQINKLLNNNYYNQAKEECYKENQAEECDFIDIGLTEESKNKIKTQIINNETISLETIENIEKAIPIVSSTFESNVTLLNLNDYINSLNCSTNDCSTISWLTEANTLSTQNTINDNNYTICITEDNELKIDTDINSSLVIKPVILLKENNFIIKGEGSRENPFVLK